ncbi:MAG: hypothetical protein KDK10_15475 [Maritimibacter sp.]|nr:hypothetical protein [Maritimibacter sp.]
MDQIVSMLSDILLGAGALGAAAYCVVLARRLKRFNNLENGVGGAVALLSAQVDDMTRTLDLARKAAGHSSDTLTALTERAERASHKLELMLASLNDLPDPAVAPAAAPVAPPVTDMPVTEPPVAAPAEAEAALDEAWAAATASATETEAQPLFSTRRSQPREAAR